MDHRKKLAYLQKNAVIKGFLKDADNYHFLLNYLDDPSPSNLKILNDAFKEFFLELRFTTYILSLIRYSAIDFDRRVRKNNYRNALLLDGKFPNAIASTYDLLSEVKFTQLEDLVTSTALFNALKKLTQKERSVLIDAYLMDMSDTSIAHKNKVSQQAISKLRSQALKKLRTQNQKIRELDFFGQFNEIVEKS